MPSFIANSVRFSLNAAEGLRSPRLLGHENRVASLSAALGECMGLTDGHLQLLRHAAGLHDVGKLAIPDSILDKPGPLDPAEWRHMQRHADYGARILRNTNDPAMRHTADIVLQHHEFWDGSGYPAGLRGDAILPEARIINLCDVYDALREDRPYKAPLSHAEAMRIILDGDRSRHQSPSCFDPELLAAVERDSDLFRRAFDTVT
jgi:putative two-component system response regulator